MSTRGGRGADRVEVFAPLSLGVLEHPSAVVIYWESGSQLAGLVRARTSADTFVVVTDGLDEANAEPAAMAVADATGRAIEVRSEAWDGETHSAFSGACVGVISGFGSGGVLAAVSHALRVR